MVKSTEANVVVGSGKQIYIVMFRRNLNNASQTATRLAAAHGGHIRHIFAALNGMSLELPDAAVAALRADPEVLTIDPDGVTTIATTQSSAPWGLDRIDQRSLPLTGSYTYYYDGSGVTVYIIDTGINTSHSDFGGRASVGYDATGGNGIDCNGHGTMVAGIVGGATYGVAKNVQLVSVKVFPNCSGSGTTEQLTMGINWVTSNKASASVANISAAGSSNSSLDAAVNSSISAGVTYAIAAGNFSANACSYSPSDVGAALVVGATDASDHFASAFSDFGSCVSLNAPGVSITSDSVGSTTATGTDNGTSFAAPFVAGTAAQYLQEHPGSTPAQIKAAILAQASVGKISSGLPSGTANLLAYEPAISNSVSGTYRMYPGSTVCPVYASATGGSGSYVYTWSWTTTNGGSAGGYSPTNGTFELNASSPMNYTVNLTVVATDSNGLQGTSTWPVSISTAAWGCS